nr:MAG TPA: hypothetical protein [Caudoviricetes sp.]
MPGNRFRRNTNLVAVVHFPLHQIGAAHPYISRINNLRDNDSAFINQVFLDRDRVTRNAFHRDKAIRHKVRFCDLQCVTSAEGNHTIANNVMVWNGRGNRPESPLLEVVIGVCTNKQFKCLKLCFKHLICVIRCDILPEFGNSHNHGYTALRFRGIGRFVFLDRDLGHFIAFMLAKPLDHAAFSDLRFAVGKLNAASVNAAELGIGSHINFVAGDFLRFLCCHFIVHPFFAYAILMLRRTPAWAVFFSTVAATISTSPSFTAPGALKSGRY